MENRIQTKSEEEVKELLNNYFSGNKKETRYSYEILRDFFNKELNKINFIELEFNNYKECYNKLAQIFYDNGVIVNYCRSVLNYKISKDSSLNGMYNFQEKKNYEYKNSYNQKECYVKCKNRIYKLKYRKLDITKFKNPKEVEKWNQSLK